MEALHLFVEARVVDGHGGLFGDSADQLDLLLREDAFALRLDEHEDAERFITEVQGHVETGLLSPMLHGGARVRGDVRGRRWSRRRPAVFKGLPVRGRVGEREGHTQVLVGLPILLMKGLRCQRVGRGIIVEDDALRRAQGLRRLSRQGGQHLVDVERGDDCATAVAQRRHSARPLLLLAKDPGVVDGEGGGHREQLQELSVLSAEAAHEALLGAAQQTDQLATVHQWRDKAALLVPALGDLALPRRPVVRIELSLEEPWLVDVRVVAGTFVQRDVEAEVLLVLGSDVQCPVAGGDHGVVGHRVVEDVGGERPHRLGSRARHKLEDILEDERRGHSSRGLEQQGQLAVLFLPSRSVLGDARRSPRGASLAPRRSPRGKRRLAAWRAPRRAPCPSPPSAAACSR